MAVIALCVSMMEAATRSATKSIGWLLQAALRSTPLAHSMICHTVSGAAFLSPMRTSRRSSTALVASDLVVRDVFALAAPWPVPGAAAAFLRHGPSRSFGLRACGLALVGDWSFFSSRHSWL